MNTLSEVARCCIRRFAEPSEATWTSSGSQQRQAFATVAHRFDDGCAFHSLGKRGNNEPETRSACDGKTRFDS